MSDFYNWYIKILNVTIVSFPKSGHSYTLSSLQEHLTNMGDFNLHAGDWYVVSGFTIIPACLITSDDLELKQLARYRTTLLVRNCYCFRDDAYIIIM